jgi:hypothetical protein
MSGTSLAYEQIGNYVPGCFYSQSFAGVRYEHELVKPTGVGRTAGKAPGGPQKTMRLVTLLHETCHLVHDLCLGSCVDLDYVRDASSAVLRAAIRQIQSSTRDPVRVPLLAAGNRYQWALDGELRTAVRFAERAAAYSERVEGVWPGLDRYALDLSGEFAAEREDLRSLSGRALLEGLVATKTACAIADRAESYPDLAYLARYRDDLRILPESLPDLYQVARRIFDATIGHKILEGRTYRGDAWPLLRRSSGRLLSDIGFVYFADIALHLPPMSYQEQRVAEGHNAEQDFIPVRRFCQAIAIASDWGRLPPGDANPEHYYAQLFDAIADAARPRWPSFGETAGAWKLFLSYAKATRRESADGYRFRMMVEREKRPHAIVMGDPMEACWSQYVPILHLTPTGYKQLRLVQFPGQSYAPLLEIPDMAVNDFFYTKIPPWQDTPDGASLEEALNIDVNNVRRWRQEVVYRAFCTSLDSALLSEECLVCPFSRGGCRARQDGCSRITELDSIPETGCPLRDYLRQDGLEARRIIWLGPGYAKYG